MKRVEAPALREVPSVSAEGKVFRRFLAQDVPASGVLRVALGGASLQGNGKVILSDFGSGSIQMITSGGSGGTPKVPKPWMVLLRFVRGDGSGSPVI